MTTGLLTLGILVGVIVFFAGVSQGHGLLTRLPLIGIMLALICAILIWRRFGGRKIL